MNFLLNIFILLAPIFSVGFAKKFKESEVEDFAHQLTENALIGINEEDYSKFSKDFNEEMLKAIPENKFVDLITTIKSKIGNYVENSKKFISAMQKDNSIIILYDTKFTLERVFVRIIISFKKIGEIYKISGLYFNSPKLRK